MLEVLPGALGKGAVVVGNEMSFGLAEKVIPGVREIREDWQAKATPGQILFVQITGRAATVCFTAAAAIVAAPTISSAATTVTTTANSAVAAITTKATAAYVWASATLSYAGQRFIETFGPRFGPLLNSTGWTPVVQKIGQYGPPAGQFLTGAVEGFGTGYQGEVLQRARYESPAHGWGMTIGYALGAITSHVWPK